MHNRAALGIGAITFAALAGLGVAVVLRSRGSDVKYQDAHSTLLHEGQALGVPSTKSVGSRQLPDPALDSSIERMESEINWIDDGLCYVRALRGAAMLYESAESVGIRDARIASIAVISGPFPDHPDWPYHAAVAYRDRDDRVQVFDGLVNSSPMTPDQWARKLGVDPSLVTFVSPLATTDFQRTRVDSSWSARLIQHDSWSPGRLKYALNAG